MTTLCTAANREGSFNTNCSLSKEIKLDPSNVKEFNVEKHLWFINILMV